jgi:cytochrome c-type biogenesis protein
VFALVPAYVGYLSGRSAGNPGAGRWQTLAHAVAFVLGFSIVFILLGMGASALGSALFNLRPYLTKIGGVVVVLFGLHMTGLIRIPFLQYDTRRQQVPDQKWGYLSAALLGVFFSAGWSPCVGPILGTILTLSINTGSVSQGFWMLLAYSAGLAIPFLIAAVQISLVTTALRRYGRAIHSIEVAMGVVMIVVGVLLFFGRFQQIARFGTFFTSINEVQVGIIILFLLSLAVVLGLIPALIASRKGRSFVDWWFFGAALIFVALPAALLIKPVPDGQPEVPPLPPDEREAVV